MEICKKVLWRPLLPLIALITAVIAISACTPHYLWNTGNEYAKTAHITDHETITRTGVAVLPHDASIFVAPLSGSQDQALAAQLGSNIHAALQTYFPRVALAAVDSDRAAAQLAASQLKFDYIIYPELVSLRETDPEVGRVKEALSPRPAADIRLVVMEVRSGYTVDVATLRGESGLLTYWGDKPAELLKAPLDDFARRLKGYASRARDGV